MRTSGIDPSCASRRTLSGCPNRDGARARWATRYLDVRSTWSRHHADARTTAASARSSRCVAAIFIPIRSSASSPTLPTRGRTARAPFFSSTTTSRSTSSRFEALCRGDHRCGVRRHRLHRAGHDRAHRAAWRAAGAAHEAGRLPLRLSRHRERARRRSRRSCRRARKNARREQGRTGRQRQHSRRSSTFTGTACTSSAASSSATRTTRTSRSAANLAFARRYVDWPYIQHPTPYPGTPMTRRLPRARADCRRRRVALRRDDGGRAQRASGR